MKRKEIADVHCHPTMKPFYHSLPEGKNSPKKRHKNSIWHYAPPDKIEEDFETLTSAALYSQANFTAMAKGNVRMFCTALYSLEMGFIKDGLAKKLGEGVARAATSFVTGIPMKDVKHIEDQIEYDYFSNLKMEHDFLLQLNNKKVKLGCFNKWKYMVVRSYNELQLALNEKKTLAVVISIEGGHNFAPRVLSAEEPMDEAYKQQMLANLKEVKHWEYRPLYITVVHHFYNGICGNTKSFPPGIAAKNLDQSYMLGTPMTELGEAFINMMLDDSEGKRILVDCKHLSLAGRIRYYELLQTKYKGQNIPILYTHAGVNGRHSIHTLYEKGQEEKWPVDAYCQEEPSLVDAQEYNDWCINLFDDEIVLIAKSKGLIGIEFDRRIAGLHKSDDIKSRKVDVHEWAGLIWNNIEHIANVLDKQGLPAWDCMSIGSDFDGIINTIYGIWTEEQLPEFREILRGFVSDYLKNNTLNEINAFDEGIIVDKIMSDNWLDFMKRNLK